MFEFEVEVGLDVFGALGGSPQHLARTGASVWLQNATKGEVTLEVREAKSKKAAGKASASLTETPDQVVDIAQGLGDKVVMVGMSLGGVTTGWAAQNRSDVDSAVLISPAFGFKAVPSALTVPVMRVYRLMPNSYTWWNAELKDADVKIPYAYPRYATRTLAQTTSSGVALA